MPQLLLAFADVLGPKLDRPLANIAEPFLAVARRQEWAWAMLAVMGVEPLHWTRP